jgi:hypothetical protein
LKNDRARLPFTHLPKGKKARTFEGQVLKRHSDYSLVHPDRQFIIQLVRFTPGKGPKDWVAFHKNKNALRHKMDIHEIATFLTWGKYDMIVLWDAKDLKTYNEFLASWINPNGQAPGIINSYPVAMGLSHERN